jgi:hypothetical protein
LEVHKKSTASAAERFSAKIIRHCSNPLPGFGILSIQTIAPTMKKLLVLAILLGFIGCKSNEPDRLIVGDWVLREYVPVDWAGSGPKQTITDNWWIEKFTRSGKYEQIIRDTVRISADYSISADGKTMEFSNALWYDRGVKQTSGVIGLPFSIYTLDKQTLTYTSQMSEASIYTFHRKR